MTTVSEDAQFQNFIKEELMVDISLLDKIITWMDNNLQPEDVFSNEQLEEWAKDKGYSK